MKQIQIKHENTIDVCWMDAPDNLKVGQFITLKGENSDERWEVVKIWDTVVDKNTLYKPWKVGGLG